MNKKAGNTTSARHVDFLLVGGGPASATAADTLRAEGAAGTIVIVAAEPQLPYCRPPLSKQFLLGTQTRDQLDIFNESDYRQNQIEILSGVRALAVEPGDQIVRTDKAGSFHYNKLLIATGSRPRPLKSIEGGDLPGIYYLRSLPDAVALKDAAQTARRAIVLGGSFIGMELASTLTQKGIAVTLITRADMLMDKLNTPLLSEFFLRYFRKRGVEIIFNDTVSRFYGNDRVEGVTTQGGRDVPCDMAVIGVGVTPEIEFLNGSGILINDGIRVDEYLQTNQPNIFAAGDIANFYDPVFGAYRRFEHWDNALKQGRLAAKNMLGFRQAYNECSYFFSDLFDLTFEFFGDLEGIDEWIERGALIDKSFALLYLKEDKLRAFFCIGRPPQETKAAESLIRHQVNLMPFKNLLGDLEFRLEDIPAQTVLILQGGGAMGAFECGVVQALEEADIRPDIVAGVSIGAFNAAVIAGNPGHAGEALEAFWSELALDTSDVPDEFLRRLWSSWQCLVFGAPNFFRPRWLMPVSDFRDIPVNWTNFYDPSPVKDLLNKYIDFQRLKTSPVRVLINAVNVQTAQLETFDSYVDDLTADHILASGSLPPGFPWTAINGRYYWDGGIVSNSPLDQIIEHCGGTGKRIFVVDLYPSIKPLPENLTQVLVRRDEIVYSERIRKDMRTRETMHDIRRLIDEILNVMEPMTAGQIKQRPHYIQVMGDLAPMSITRIVREGEESDLPARDYDFSRKSIEKQRQQGYRMTLKVLGS